ncbi:MAG: hypothetical protein K6U03_03200 [Firmicutes bacterium]|nr:hypothetical protein [Bacillota bacterium]
MNGMGNPTATKQDTASPSAPVVQRSVFGWIIALLNGLAAINSTVVFLVVLRTGVTGWLMMNSCAPSVILFLIGFLLGSRILMTAAAVMMFRYGTLGLFVFSWSGPNIAAQIGHILMTLAVIYVAVDLVRHRRWRELGLGVALGVAVLIPYMDAQGE